MIYDVIIMKALLNIRHTIEINHIRYYEWTLHIVSSGFIGQLKSRKDFDCQGNALRSAKRVAKKLGIRIIKQFRSQAPDLTVRYPCVGVAEGNYIHNTP